MFKKTQLTSKKFARKKKQFFRIKVTLSVILLGLVFFGVYFLSRSKAITISTVEVKGALVVGSEDIKTLAFEKLSGDYVMIFPRKNAFWYPQAEIESAILETWKRVEAVSVKRTSLTSIEITITEKKPKFLWCGKNLPEGVVFPDCYFIDDSGYVFAKAPLFSDNVYFRFFGMIDGENPIGKKYLPDPDFKEVTDFLLDLQKSAIEPSRLFSKDKGEYELYLEDGTRVFFNNRQDLSKTALNLSTLLESDAFKKDIKASQTPIDYIDLRYGNKLFYKFK